MLQAIYYRVSLMLYYIIFGRIIAYLFHQWLTLFRCLQTSALFFTHFQSALSDITPMYIEEIGGDFPLSYFNDIELPFDD